MRAKRDYGTNGNNWERARLGRMASIKVSSGSHALETSALPVISVCSVISLTSNNANLWS